jgi:hypothetical protein
MDNDKVDEGVLASGAYCNKGSPTCFCKVGWPKERQCPACRDRWPVGVFRDSYCICPPDDEMEEP